MRTTARRIAVAGAVWCAVPMAAAGQAPGERPSSGEGGVPSTFRWGPQRPDLVRYDRVEGLSLGARGQIYPRTFLGRLSVTGTARLGSADRAPNARLDATHESLELRVTLSAYHELAAVEEDARHLGLGNSLTAFLLGRDDGDYYRRTGIALEWTPPAAERRAFRVRAHAEYHGFVARSADFAVAHIASDGWAFRENLRAREGWDSGWTAEAAPWWGTDPRALRGGVALRARKGWGDWSYTTVDGRGTILVPVPGDVRIEAEVAGGTSWGEPPPQRWFLMGGATTLRGYEPVARAGTSFARIRGAVARHFAFGAVSLFSDAAWAGPRDAFDGGDALVSAGVGLALVDGLIRADAAWGLRDPKGFRLELYLDGIP